MPRSGELVILVICISHLDAHNGNHRMSFRESMVRDDALIFLCFTDYYTLD